MQRSCNPIIDSINESAFIEKLKSNEIAENNESIASYMLNRFDRIERLLNKNINESSGVSDNMDVYIVFDSKGINESSKVIVKKRISFYITNFGYAILDFKFQGEEIYIKLSKELKEEHLIMFQDYIRRTISRFPKDIN